MISTEESEAIQMKNLGLMVLHVLLFTLLHTHFYRCWEKEFAKNIRQTDRQRRGI